MKFIKNTGLIVVIGYCILVVLAISGVVTVYLEMVKSSHISEGPDPKEKLIALNNTLNDLYQAEGTAVIIMEANNQNIYYEYDSLMSSVFERIDSMKSTEKNPQILLDLDSLTTLLEKKLYNFREMIYLMGQLENNVVSEIANTTINSFADIDKLDNILFNQMQSVKSAQDTVKQVVEKEKNLGKRILKAFSGKTDTLTQIVSSSTANQFELVVPLISDTLVQHIKETNTIVQKKNEKIIKALMERQNEFHLINNQTGVKIDQIVDKIKTAEYQNSIAILTERNKMQAKSYNQAVTIGLLALIIAIFFMSWTLVSIRARDRLQKKIQEAKKSVDKLLVSREQLIYTITHDIKAPISSILGFLDLLSGERISHNQQYFVKNMYTSATHILDLVKNLLDFQSLEKSRQKINLLSFSPGSLINDIYSSFQPLAQKKKLAFELYSTIPTEQDYIGDPYRIKQILNNLISNAFKFTPDEGTIVLWAFIEKESIFHISVKDSGPGINTEDKNRIFEEFIRLDETKETAEGTGLGLTISQKLAALMNGNIDIQSKKGQGAEFILTVPIIPVEKETVTAPVTSSGEIVRILFVDDDAVQLNLLSELMKRFGLSYACSMTSSDALKLLETESFSIVFTDIHIPDIKGFELAEKIRKSSFPSAKTIPVIGFSADSHWKDNHSQTGFTDFLSKPFKVEDILKIIEKYTGQTVSFDDTSFKSFDLSNIENLLDYVSGDREAALNMVDSFIDETKNNLKLLGKALDSKDLETIKQISHKMSSLMNMMASPEIVSILNLFEKGEHSEKNQVTLSLLLAKQSRKMKTLRNELINL